MLHQTLESGKPVSSSAHDPEISQILIGQIHGTWPPRKTSQSSRPGSQEPSTPTKRTLAAIYVFLIALPWRRTAVACWLLPGSCFVCTNSSIRIWDAFMNPFIFPASPGFKSSSWLIPCSMREALYLLVVSVLGLWLAMKTAEMTWKEGRSRVLWIPFPPNFKDFQWIKWPSSSLPECTKYLFFPFWILASEPFRCNWETQSSGVG